MISAFQYCCVPSSQQHQGDQRHISDVMDAHNAVYGTVGSAVRELTLLLFGFVFKMQIMGVPHRNPLKNLLAVKSATLSCAVGCGLSYIFTGRYFPESAVQVLLLCSVLLFTAGQATRPQRGEGSRVPSSMPQL
jgi:hypothetical protein